MTYLDELWRTLFGVEINPVEERIMSRIADRVDRDSTVLLLAAILVRMLYEICYGDELGPFEILRNLAKSCEDQRRITVLIAQTYERLQPRLAEIDGLLLRVENTLAEARELGEAKTGYHPMLGHIPTGEPDNAQLSKWSVMLVCGAACIGTFLGLTICLMIFFR